MSLCHHILDPTKHKSIHAHRIFRIPREEESPGQTFPRVQTLIEVEAASTNQWQTLAS